MTMATQEALSLSERIKATTLPEGYTPKDGEPYMSLQHLAYFRQKLLEWRGELLRDTVETIHHMQDP